MNATPANNGKDTIYIDVDDEITTIIDKVKDSKAKIVALVLPKRAAVLQSVVNMKLLKRNAETHSKQVVLITTETALLPLAGSVGLHVASSLQSKPEIPVTPQIIDGSAGAEESLSLEDDPDTEYTSDNAGDKPVGELSKAASAASLPITAGVETVNLDEPEGPAASAPAAKSAKKGSKKPKVPNFNAFRLRLLLAGLGAVLLIVFLYLAIAVLPHATVEIGTNASDINSTIPVTLDTTASHVNLVTGVVPATSVQQQKTYTQQVDTTGQQNNGHQAKGSVAMSAGACSGDQPADVPQGTGLSAHSLTYITQETASFGPVIKGGHCTWQSNSVDITAQTGGSNYNVGSGTTFSVAGRSEISATGSASGGTDDIEQIVTQGDIDSAKSKINLDDTAIKQALYQQLKSQNLFPVSATFSSGTPNVTTSANVGDSATTVTVTEVVTYTMLGTNRGNLLTLIKQDIDQQIDTTKQGIIADGINKASFSLQNATDTAAQVSMQNTATVGPKIDTDSLAQQIAGKKAGDAKTLINQIPGVTDVNVKLSPFWVGGIPKNASKITIHVGKAGSSQNGS
jgi:hypothetical protein